MRTRARREGGFIIRSRDRIDRVRRCKGKGKKEKKKIKGIHLQDESEEWDTFAEALLLRLRVPTAP